MKINYVTFFYVNLLIFEIFLLAQLYDGLSVHFDGVINFRPFVHRMQGLEIPWRLRFYRQYAFLGWRLDFRLDVFLF